MTSHHPAANWVLSTPATRESGQWLYLGYSLPLSPTESCILTILAAHATHSMTALAADDLIQALTDLSASETDVPHVSTLVMSRSQLAVHILRINRKAAAISERRLILCHRHHGYRLNPYA